MRLSLLGKMSGEPDWGYPLFRECAREIRARGHEVFNPAETADGDTSRPRAEYMRASIGALLRADGVVLLPGWENSPGAKTEMRVALSLGLSVVTYEALITGRSGMARPELPDGPDE